MKNRIIVFIIGAMCFLFQDAFAADFNPIVNRLQQDGLDAAALNEVFSRPEVEFLPAPMSMKVTELVKIRFYTGKPGRKKPSGAYKALLKPEPIARARSFMLDNAAYFNGINERYGVSGEAVTAILLVETNLGRFLGGRKAFNVLASMALSSDLNLIRAYLPENLLSTPEREEYAWEVCRKRSDWAYNELKALLLYSFQAGVDPLSMPGSIYGALGLCQFMPSNINKFAVDGDGDGRLDLFTKADAIPSIANYLKMHGWREGKDAFEARKKAVFAYNRSMVYVDTVLSVATILKGGEVKGETKRKKTRKT